MDKWQTGQPTAVSTTLALEKNPTKNRPQSIQGLSPFTYYLDAQESEDGTETCYTNNGALATHITNWPDATIMLTAEIAVFLYEMATSWGVGLIQKPYSWRYEVTFNRWSVVSPRTLGKLSNRLRTFVLFRNLGIFVMGMSVSWGNGSCFVFQPGCRHRGWKLSSSPIISCVFSQSRPTSALQCCEHIVHTPVYE